MWRIFEPHWAINGSRPLKTGENMSHTGVIGGDSVLLGLCSPRFIRIPKDTK